MKTRICKQKADLFVVPTNSLGGAERVLQILSKCRAEQGNQVVVLVLCDSKAKPWKQILPNIKLVHMNCSGELTAAFYLPIVITRLQNKYRFKYVYTSHTHINAAISFFIKLKVLRCCSHIMRESTVIIDRFNGCKLYMFQMLYFFYGKPNLLICQTLYMQQQLERFIPRSKKWNIIVQPNPFDIIESEKKLQEKVEYSHPIPQKYIVSVSRLIPIKGIDFLIKAFATISEQHANLYLVIAGTGPDKLQLSNLSERLGIAEKVIFLGKVDNPFPLMQKSILGVISSLKEGFPNTLLEMMFCCKKIVSTRCAGGIEDLRCVYHCAPGSVYDLSKALQNAISKDPVDQEIFHTELNQRKPSDYIEVIEHNLLR